MCKVKQMVNQRKENKTMTQREFFNAVINGNITDEVKDTAKGALEKLDERNAKRAAKPSKTAIENQPIKEAIVSKLTESGKAMLSPEVAVAVGITTAKASALLTQLVNDGKVVKVEVKVPKKGKMMSYSIK